MRARSRILAIISVVAVDAACDANNLPYKAVATPV